MALKLSNAFGAWERDRPLAPGWEGVEPFRCRSHDEQPVAGWARASPDALGTVFIGHGFTDHCMKPGVVATARAIAARHRVSVVAIDFRSHGLSSDRWPTFGTAEMWDYQAAMTWAEEQQGYPKPFFLHGASLGAMGAQRTAVSDGRVRGVFLQSPPAWPWHALGVATKIASPLVGSAINLSYGWDILSDGDIRRHSASPAHKPLICCVIGGRDHYGVGATRKVFEHWYRNELNQLEILPREDAMQTKWFLTVEPADHFWSTEAECEPLDQIMHTYFAHALSR